MADAEAFLTAALSNSIPACSTPDITLLQSSVPPVPRGAIQAGGDERAPPLACRSRLTKLRAACPWKRREGWEAALTTTGRPSTARWIGPGKQGRKA